MSPHKMSHPRSRRLDLFATRADYEPVIRKVEAQQSLKYVLYDLFWTPTLTVYSSALEIKDLGVAFKGDAGFGGSPTLQAGDGTAPADASAVCTMSNASSSGAISQGKIAPAAFRYINRTGRTQFRLRFTLVSASRYGTDYTGFYGGHIANALENRPRLVIVYHIQAL